MPSSFPGPSLPVEAALPALRKALADAGRAVLVAPPGAGKTTLAPLALMDEPWASGRIVMLEPRRLAARAAAARMADLLGEPLGRRIGYRIRGEAKTSKETRVEVVTEGVLTRMLQADPELPGVSAVIFDEFHERSLNADLGLALTWEARGALREDLRLLVMSATLDAAGVAAILGDAPVVRSQGRAYPVETRWLDRPWRDARRGRFEDAAAALIRDAHGAGTGDILAFLPGAREIDGVSRRLADLSVATDIRPLFGAMSLDAQRAALAPAAAGRRKIVLATAIAETSLTVEGVRIVVDAGQARRARYDPNSGMSRLVTERVSKAEATQRAGRAGRLAPGVCYRMWTKGEEGAMAAFAPPEIETADLTSFALELANWGASEEDLALLTPPPAGALGEARALLAALGALDDAGRVTKRGREIAAAPTHPRLAHMILDAPKAERGVACAVAALLEARDPLRGRDPDIGARLKALEAPERAGPAEAALRAIQRDAARLAKTFGARAAWRSADVGALIARAYPDRVALRRKGGEARYLLSGGKGARLNGDGPMAGETLLAVADLDGDAREAAIRLAAPVSRAALDEAFGAQIQWAETCRWSRRDRRVEARRRLMFGALALEDHPWRDAPEDAVVAAMAEGVRALGLDALPWTADLRRLIGRVEWARARGASAPSCAPDHLEAELETWLAPYLRGIANAGDLGRVDLAAALDAHLGWEGRREVDRVAPDAFVAPTGARHRIDYGGAQPTVRVRLQEMFGLDAHPFVGGSALTIELLSPAQRPVQTTADLPGFWRTSYADVRKDMRGRYPKHPWPEDPLTAPPTTRAKPRGGS